MRRRKGMVRSVPAIFLVVILEHGKVGDPEEFEVARHVAGALECLVLVCVLARQFQPGFAARSVLRFLVGGGARLAFGGNADYRNNQIVSAGFAQLADFCRYLRTLLFKLSKVIEHASEVLVP